MGVFKRWLSEARNPSLKCDRIGHVLGVEFREGYRKPDWLTSERRFIAIYVRQERPICARCKQWNGPWQEVQSDGFHSYSWPSEMAHQFDRDGEYWRRQGTTGYHAIELKAVKP